MTCMHKQSFILLCLLIFCGTGCTYRSTYQKKVKSPNELHWGYQNGLQIRKGIQVYSQANNWNGLAKALACLPKAQQFAIEAQSDSQRGKWLVYSGVGIGIAGSVFTIASIYVFGFTSHSLEGLAMIFGGSIAGLAGFGLVRFGNSMHGRSSTRAFDALEYYNDYYQTEKRCRTSKSMQTLSQTHPSQSNRDDRP